jgi:quinol monooxygenase YgiN
MAITVFQLKTSVNADNRMELLQTLQTLMEPIQRERGCLGVAVYLNGFQEGSALIEMEWENRQQLIAHLKSEPFAVLLGAMDCLSTPEKLKFKILSQIQKTEDVNSLLTNQ